MDASGGGMFLLLSLPDRIRAAAWLDLAFLNNVAFAPGDNFHLDGAAQLPKRVF
jgi:DNA-binding transcriptional MocR family regulator